MKREIYEVHMAYVNKDGYHASDPSGYPKIVDSATAEYNNAGTVIIRMGV